MRDLGRDPDIEATERLTGQRGLFEPREYQVEAILRAVRKRMLPINEWRCNLSKINETNDERKRVS